jgi:hypothetical protein
VDEQAEEAVDSHAKKRNWKRKKRELMEKNRLDQERHRANMGEEARQKALADNADQKRRHRATEDAEERKQKNRKAQESHRANMDEEAREAVREQDRAHKQTKRDAGRDVTVLDLRIDMTDAPTAEMLQGR